MDYKNIPILHVDGSLSEYVDKQGILNQIGGIGGYLIQNGKVIDRFHKTLSNVPFINKHEDYAIIEGLKWVKDKKIDTIKIKTDSLSSVNLFNNQKKAITKEDKFFLAQFLMFEFMFDLIEISYFSRTEDDISHQLSRMYMKEIPKGVKRIKHADIKNKNLTQTIDSFDEQKISKILIGSIKEIL